jgi:hypothetical protein
MAATKTGIGLRNGFNKDELPFLGMNIFDAVSQLGEIQMQQTQL